MVHTAPPLAIPMSLRLGLDILYQCRLTPCGIMQVQLPLVIDIRMQMGSVLTSPLKV